MKIKVSEMTTFQLDWAVAKCENQPKTTLDPFTWKYIAYPTGCYAYSRNWEVGGPIIERERIRLDCPWGNIWKAQHEFTAKKDGCTGWVSGPTPLIAAMRCYVASKLGEEVEVPDELGVSE